MSEIRESVREVVREALRSCVLDWVATDGDTMRDMLAAYEQKRSGHFNIPNAEIEAAAQSLVTEGLLKAGEARFELTKIGREALGRYRAFEKDVKDRRDRVKDRAVEVFLSRLGTGEGRRGVDVGTGEGFLAFKLAATGFGVVGVDINAERIEKARKNAAAEGIEGVIFQTGDINSLREAGAFDVVVSRYVFHHLEDVEGTLKGMHECLKPDGKLVCIDFQVGMASFIWHGFITFCALTETEWAKRLAQAGFEEVRIHEVEGLLMVEAKKPNPHLI